MKGKLVIECEYSELLADKRKLQAANVLLDGELSAMCSNELTNQQAANCLIGNALAYARSEYMSAPDKVRTILCNLEIIERLLEHPDDECTEYTWDDFK